jgi:hypothetical protein
VKNRIEIPEAPRGKRGRRERDDEPKAEDKAPRKWKERDGFHQGAKVTRR